MIRKSKHGYIQGLSVETVSDMNLSILDLKRLSMIHKVFNFCH
jgi:hypothetical protein